MRVPTYRVQTPRQTVESWKKTRVWRKVPGVVASLRYLQAMYLPRIAIVSSAVITAAFSLILCPSPLNLRAIARDSPNRTYLGFDLNT